VALVFPLNHVGMAISHAYQSSCTGPSRPLASWSQHTGAETLRVVRLTGGPPASVERSMSCPSSARDHSTIGRSICVRIPPTRDSARSDGVAATGGTDWMRESGAG
jgi:hypothetical protein